MTQDPAAVIAARLDRLPMSRSLWTMTLLIALGGAFEFYNMFFTAYVAPGMVASGMFTPASLGPLGFLVGIVGGGPATFVFSTFIGLFFGTMLCSPVSDWLGRKRVFCGALIWYSVTTAIMAFQHTGFALNTWRFISGLGLGVQLVTVATYLSELAPRRYRGRVFAFSFTIEFSAVPIVVFLAWILQSHRPLGLESWRWVMLIGTSGALLVLAVQRMLPESPRWLARNGRQAEAEEVTARIEAAVERETGPLPPPGPAIPENTGRSTFADLWKGIYGRRTVVLSAFNFFQAIGYYGFAAWVPTLLVSKGITVTTSLLYSFVIATANPVGPLLGYLLADRMERKHQIVLSALLIAVFGLIFASLTTAPMLMICGAAITLCNNWLAFAFHNYQAEIFPTRIRARAVGFVYSWSRLSTAFVGLLIGYLLHSRGVMAVFIMMAGAMVITMLLIGLFGPRTRGLALEEICPDYAEPTVPEAIAAA